MLLYDTSFSKSGIVLHVKTAKILNLRSRKLQSSIRRRGVQILGGVAAKLEGGGLKKVPLGGGVKPRAWGGVGGGVKKISPPSAATKKK